MIALGWVACGADGNAQFELRNVRNAVALLDGCHDLVTLTTTEAKQEGCNWLN